MSATDRTYVDNGAQTLFRSSYVRPDGRALHWKTVCNMDRKHRKWLKRLTIAFVETFSFSLPLFVFTNVDFLLCGVQTIL